ncbi:MAG: MBL fold metallo-hydrolase, partial [Pseudomonadota bacterium]|nr:MBL fold metallo-hydrolase [Pseudomonadota bacterium]
DFPGGNAQQLKQSIESQIYSLPEDYTVYPGHGPTTTVGHEKRTNPFTSGRFG